MPASAKHDQTKESANSQPKVGYHSTKYEFSGFLHVYFIGNFKTAHNQRTTTA